MGRLSRFALRRSRCMGMPTVGRPTDQIIMNNSHVLPPPALRARPALLCAGLALVLAGAAQAAPPAVPTIVGGTEVAEGQYPFVVSLQQGRHFCGGSLVAPDTVLTAAHCVEGVQPSRFTVLAGQTVLSGTNGTRHKVSSIHVHPGYEQTAVGDVAVLKLETPVQGITPVTLLGREGASHEQAGRLFTVAGWGRLTEGGRAPDRMQHVAVPFITHAECQRQYQGRQQIDQDKELCASVPGKDSCQGDSGGPLFLQAADESWVQLGVVSWGIGCARQGSPGVYSRLASGDLEDFVRGLIE